MTEHQYDREPFDSSTHAARADRVAVLTEVALRDLQPLIRRLVHRALRSRRVRARAYRRFATRRGETGCSSFGTAWDAIARDPSIVDDLVQEVMIVAWPPLALLAHDRMACERWLSAAVPLVVVGRLARSLRSVASLAGVAGEDDDGGAFNPVDAAAAPANDNAEMVLIAGETQAALERAVSNLPALDREVVHRTARGEEPTEIAVELGMNRATVRVKLHRARQRIALALSGEGGAVS